MGDLGEDGCEAGYGEALVCLDGALEVWAAGDAKPRWARCARNRARVAGMLAGRAAVGGIMSTTEGRVHLAPGVPM